MWEGFYAPHRAQKNPLHNDDCIYTPGVVVFKSDTAAPQALPPDEWYTVNVLTCAAPNLRQHPGNQIVQIGKQELRQLHEKRMRRIMSLAASEGNEVVILGAFGCGAYSNPPEVVAEAMRTVVREYRSLFQIIEFAVFCPPRDDSNYRVFERVLGRI